jgi:hypothetical protein
MIRLDLLFFYRIFLRGFPGAAAALAVAGTSGGYVLYIISLA